MYIAADCNVSNGTFENVDIFLIVLIVLNKEQ